MMYQCPDYQEQENDKDFTLWDLLSANDIFSKWVVFYALLNNQMENEYLRNLIINYASDKRTGRNRIGLYLE